MVRIFEANPKKSFLRQLGEGVAEHAPPAIREYLLEQKEEKEKEYKSKLIEQENEEIKDKFGYDISPLTDPKSRSAVISKLYDEEIENETINKILGISSKKSDKDMPKLTNPILSDDGVTEEGNEEIAKAMPHWNKLTEEQKAFVSLKYPREASVLQKQGEYEQEQAQLSQSLQNAEEIWKNPELSPEEKTFHIFQELKDHPQIAKNLLSTIQEQSEAETTMNVENLAGKQFSRGYNAILENNTDTLKEVLGDPNTPLSVKKHLTDLKDKYDIRKGVESRELRSRQLLVQKSYKEAINAEKNKLRGGHSESETNKINARIKKLESLQKKDLAMLTKDPESYPKLNLWGNLDPDFLPDEVEENEMLDQEEEPQEKVKFNPRNPEHSARARQVLQEVNGDRAKANEILFTEFYK